MIRIDHIGMPACDAKASAHFRRDALGLHEAEPEAGVLR
jgi:catechol 2,3-dioxygenase-like lactoylglutathione lyase family enzyme